MGIFDGLEEDIVKEAVAEKKKEFAPIPKGNYEAILLESELEMNGKYWAGDEEFTGPVLKWTFELKSEPWVGRRIWMNYPIDDYKKWGAETERGKKLKKNLLTVGTSLLRLGADIDKEKEKYETPEQLAAYAFSKVGAAVEIWVWNFETKNGVKNYCKINQELENGLSNAPSSTGATDSVLPSFDSDEVIPF